MSDYEGPPPPNTAAAKTVLIVALWGTIISTILNVGMMIVSIMAYTGAAGEDDRKVIKDARITFPPNGHHVQRAEIALSSLSLIMDFTLCITTLVYVYRLRGTNYSETDLFKSHRMVTFFLLPWHAICLAGWALCAGFQISYVPVLGTKVLPECELYGDELTQCGMVTASWIMAWVYCADHITRAIFALVLRHRLVHFVPEPEGQSMLLTNNTPAPAAAPPGSRSRPPSYRSNASQPPAYFRVLPNDKDASKMFAVPE